MRNLAPRQRLRARGDRNNANGSSRSTTSSSRATAAASSGCSRPCGTTRAWRASPCRSPPSPPTSTPSGRRTKRRSPAARRSSAASRAWSAGTRWRWSCAPTALSDGIGGHISTYASAATLYEVAFNHFFRGKGQRRRRRHHLFPGPRLARHLRARVPRRAALGREAGELPPRAAPGRRAVVVSASVADAGLLGVPDRLDGARPDHVDLPGALQSLPRGSRPEEAVDRQGLGVPRRRRDRRARIARRHQPRGAREARQPDLRHQLQPAAPRRPGARQRPDHPGARSDLPRRRLERHQGALGQRLGSAARQGSRRPARQADGRGRRRPVPEVRRRVRRLLPRALLRHRSAAARDGQAPLRRPAEEAAPRRPRPGEGLQRLQGARSSTRGSRPSSSRARSRATAWAKRAKARTSPTSRRR